MMIAIAAWSDEVSACYTPNYEKAANDLGDLSHFLFDFQRHAKTKPKSMQKFIDHKVSKVKVS